MNGSAKVAALRVDDCVGAACGHGCSMWLAGILVVEPVEDGGGSLEWVHGAGHEVLVTEEMSGRFRRSESLDFLTLSGNGCAAELEWGGCMYGMTLNRLGSCIPYKP